MFMIVLHGVCRLHRLLRASDPGRSQQVNSLRTAACGNANEEDEGERITVALRIYPSECGGNGQLRSPCPGQLTSSKRISNVHHSPPWSGWHATGYKVTFTRCGQIIFGSAQLETLQRNQDKPCQREQAADHSETIEGDGIEHWDERHPDREDGQEFVSAK
jgi:hypothetical protein